MRLALVSKPRNFEKYVLPSFKFTVFLEIWAKMLGKKPQKEQQLLQTLQATAERAQILAKSRKKEPKLLQTSSKKQVDALLD